MGIATERMGTQTIDKQEHDVVEYRRRVATWVDGNSVAYEDTNFTSGESATVLAIQTDLGRKAHKGYFINDGPGNIQLEISYDGSVYGGIHTIKGGETLVLDDLNVSKIRLTHVDDTEYRCLAS